MNERTLPLLLEIGCEEIPARFLEAAEKGLGQLLLQGVKQSRLLPEQAGSSPSDLQTYSTPRRLTAHLPRILARQPEQAEQISGPPQSAAFDAEGKPTRAAEGFAAKCGVSVGELETIKTAKGEYLAFRRVNAGKISKVLLEELLPSVIASISFPKSMYWSSKSGLRFARPIRWIVALLGEGEECQPIRCSVADVEAGDETFGHRVLGPGKINVRGFEDYSQKLRERGVEFDPRARREWIQLSVKASLEIVQTGFVVSASRALHLPARAVKLDGRLEELRSRIRALPEAAELRLVEDRTLEDWHVNSTEWPRAISGSFDHRFLQLPREILVTVMRDHQKYFAVEDRAGNLQPYFAAILNTQPDGDGLIRRGHERVLAARFTDAEFFWNSDQRVPLRERTAWLEKVTYAEKLGSYGDKVRRMRGVAAAVSNLLEAQGAMRVAGRELAFRAVDLCKCDLTTQMVQEFTELQGVIGGLYAKAQGERDEVAEAIYDHYLPARMVDRCPRTVTGCVVSLADKMDSVIAGFSASLEPTGSADPFGLRRAGNGIVKVAVEMLPGINLQRLLSEVLKSVPGYSEQSAISRLAGTHATHEKVSESQPSPRGEGGDPSADGEPGEGFRPNFLERAEERLAVFFRERLEHYLESVARARYDTIRAVVRSSGSWAVPSAAVERARGLEIVRESEDFASLAAAAKRTRNILEKSAKLEDFGASSVIDETLLASRAERELYDAYAGMKARLEEYESRRDFAGAFRAVASLRGPVDQFFDQVLVMDQNAAVRKNRLALLRQLNELVFLRLADLGEFSVPGEIVGAPTSPPGPTA